ncbi:peptidoglycan/xylan/chitin deacetylase (PgdA/CDA1 family) [Thermocatellispora tengchongensis]|uniref:Peptidoglycan/xylan/chitin deacetylase (PgdA/CDA1 family) n=1 Tax=Thermocatellispora tengchongensis TaxID=1073253 RepID=A0A840PNR8_9ACTN|nr:polysaccharide deacetylase family protein [Thermocatellispora tengchongensis]MBB5139350.1 peptidoglycan/xylan/chitin deacetylase (PgdA/CDA1 family) [Thermocatellispora tengchongensis]
MKCIALTFDDGPSASTAKLLDTLKRHRAKATFFLVGRQVEKRPGVARRMAREGHEIGNHTYSHARLTELSEQEILAEVTDAQQAIRAATGREPALMRPPFGAVDERVQAVAEFAGLPVVMWTGSTRDWELKDTRKIAAKALGLARRDAVILMHDIVPQTVAAMPKILTELRERGYHVVTVSSVLRGRELAPGQRYP